MNNEAKTLEEYKQKVRKSLIENYNRTEAGAEELMKLYEDDFPEFFEENWDIPLTIVSMIMGY